MSAHGTMGRARREGACLYIPLRTRGARGGGRSRGAWALALALLAASGCAKEEPRAVARKIESLTEAVGGPKASARVGDLLLENDQIRAVVEQGGSSSIGYDVGGTLIDLDLVRKEDRYRGGKGLDLLGQIGPVCNLYVPDPKGPSSVRVSGSRAPRAAEVTVAAEGAGVQKVIDGLALLLRRDFLGAGGDYSTGRFYTEYELRPGERMIRIRTTFGYGVPFCRPRPEDGCNAECDDVLWDDDCTCPTVPARCGAAPRVIEAERLPDRPEPMGIADLMLGDLPRPDRRCEGPGDCDLAAGEECVAITGGLGGASAVCRGPAAKDAGLFLGDMLLFGGHLSVFVPGIGYDVETDIRRLFDAGEDTLSTPLKLDAVYAVGESVSYGYAPPSGKILSPVFSGAFSLGATAAAACRHDAPGCLARTLVRAERWLTVGEGDVASAREPLLKARGEPVGTLEGTVLFVHSGKPAARAEVFALSDPRALPCEGACRTRCPDLTGLSDSRLAGWTLEELIAANRCRTPGGAHLQGVAAVHASAVADVGTDPVRDGRFRMVLPPGAYVAVAQDGERSLSSLAPFRVDAGGAVAVGLLLEEPGTLAYVLVDEAGAPVAGRAVVGRCLPGKACGSDADCDAGTTCQAGACACARKLLRPYELRGGRNPDGVLAMHQTADGRGELAMPAGEYEVVFSRGPSSDLDRRRVQLRPGLTTAVRATLPRRVDPAGLAASDFHVHGTNSLDAATGLEARVTSMLAEDLDFFSSADHDFVTDYGPTLERMNARTKLGAQVGVEVSTLEVGHFIGYPLVYREYEADGTPTIAHGAPDWTGLSPKQIFAALRALQKPGQPGVVEVAHIYSYFDSYGVHPHTLEPTDSLLSLFNPLVAPDKFGGDFDVAEVFNGKGFDMLHRATVGEARFYSEGFDGLRAQRRSGEIGEAEFAKRSYDLSTEAIRRILHRTKEEQQAALDGVPAFAGEPANCTCGSTGDCSGGLQCDPATATCVPGPLDPSRPPLPADAMCRSLRGALDDWFVMLNRGLRRTMVGSSDVHGDFEAGSPRTLVPTGGTSAPYLTEREVAQALLEGRAVVTNGPMLRFELLEPAGQIGDVVPLSGGRAVHMRVAIEVPGWFDVDRLELYRNGELLHWVRGCESRREDPSADPHAAEHGCIPIGTGKVYDRQFTDLPERDSWYVALAVGLDGRTLAPVYGSSVLARFGTFELVQRVYDLVPRLAGLRVPRFPSLFPTFPLAVTNPVRVDVGGDGWSPPWDPPSWCRPGKDFGC